MEVRDELIMSVSLKGTCEHMCPESERQLREREKLLHHLELAPSYKSKCPHESNPIWVVKSFTRSAAGHKAPQASELRPPHVLRQTIFHLVHNVITNEKIPWTSVYDFVFDRLRAVRQDMVIQALGTWDSINILEPIIRFHAYSSYRLCEESMFKFDPKINQTHLSECLKRLLVLYDEWQMEDSQEQNPEHRPEMEALYQASNLGSSEALTRALLLNKQWRTPVVNKVLEMSLQFCVGNYIRVCKLMATLPPLLACVAVHHLPAVRKHALMVMSCAFNSRVLRYPMSHLQSLLLYRDEEELRQDCIRYKLDVQDEGILFLKGSFDRTAQLSPPCHVRFLDMTMSKCNIPLLLMG